MNKNEILDEIYKEPETPEGRLYRLLNYINQISYKPAFIFVISILNGIYYYIHLEEDVDSILYGFIIGVVYFLAMNALGVVLFFASKLFSFQYYRLTNQKTALEILEVNSASFLIAILLAIYRISLLIPIIYSYV